MTDSLKEAMLTLNAGSSSTKIGLFFLKNPSEITEMKTWDVEANTPATQIAEQLQKEYGTLSIKAIGHRIVHGGPTYYKPTRINAELLETLQGFSLFDSEHLPQEINLIKAFQNLFPNTPQIACFDTAFHHDLPRVAQILPIPRHYESQGIRRYGFHGISYGFLMKEFERMYGESAARGRVILAHLGSGASITAVKDGAAIDTSMGFTPTSGLPMSTRSGDLDAGLAWYLAQKENMDPKQFNTMTTYQSGLLGISETTADMKTLLERESEDVRAAEAVAVFCYEAKKYIGAYAAALGGIDTIIFSGGMGAQAPKIRSRICENLSFLGVALDEERNDKNATNISRADANVLTLVIPTNEERMIAEEVKKLISQDNKEVL